MAATPARLDARRRLVNAYRRRVARLVGACGLPADDPIYRRPQRTGLRRLALYWLRHWAAGLRRSVLRWPAPMPRPADGRTGAPGVVEYEMVEGPRIGRRYAVPPRLAQERDDGGSARHRRAPGQGGFAYRVVVYDQAAYEALARSGWLYGEAHAGPQEPVIDNRITS